MFTIRFELALRFLGLLAEEPQLKVGEVARSLAVSPETLSKVAQTLVRAGWLEATRGPSGGYRRTNGEAISASDVLLAVEGSLPTPEHPGLAEIQERMLAELASIRV